MTRTDQSLRSRAAIPTDRADRWLTQLASHLGRKAEVRQHDHGTELLLAGGSCLMTGDDATLRFTATAPDEEVLLRVQHVVGGHLERFAHKEGLVVDWQHDALPSAKSLGLSPELHAYALAHSEPLDDVQADLVERTRASGRDARLQVAPEVAPLLTLLVRLLGAERVVEVGTFTGLSALALAKGLPAHGRLVCFDVSAPWTELARDAWSRAGVTDRVELRLGDARLTLSSLEGEPPVDLAFVDADKDGYATYLDLLHPYLRPGALVVFDNTLSRGQVLDETATGSAAAIRAFNVALLADERFEQVLLAVGDGLTLARKR